MLYPLIVTFPIKTTDRIDTSICKGNAMKKHVLTWLLINVLYVLPASADSVEARCDIYPKGEDHASDVLPCTFGMRQGYVTITRADGVKYAFRPLGDTPGNFIDQNDFAVYRQSGLGMDGVIFRTRDESIFVYWHESSLSSLESEGPFHSGDHDAVTRLRCGIRGRVETWCAAGISRSGPSNARIEIDGLRGERLVLYFEGEAVQADDRGVVAELNGDIWQLVVEKGNVFEVPLAAIDGG